MIGGWGQISKERSPYADRTATVPIESRKAGESRPAGSGMTACCSSGDNRSGGPEVHGPGRPPLLSSSRTLRLPNLETVMVLWMVALPPIAQSLDQGEIASGCTGCVWFLDHSVGHEHQGIIGGVFIVAEKNTLDRDDAGNQQIDATLFLNNVGIVVRVVEIVVQVTAPGVPLEWRRRW